MSITDIQRAQAQASQPRETQFPTNEQQLAAQSIRPSMNAAQMQALQEAARKLGEDVNLRKWAVEQAIKALETSSAQSFVFANRENPEFAYVPVKLAEQIHRFIVGQ